MSLKDIGIKICVLSMAVASCLLGSAEARDRVEVSDLKVMQMGTDSIGYTTFSIQTEACNNGDPAKVWVRGVAKNWSGYEITDFLFNGVTLQKDECRKLTKTVSIDLQQDSTVHEWGIKEVDIYKAR